MRMAESVIAFETLTNILSLRLAVNKGPLKFPLTVMALPRSQRRLTEATAENTHVLEKPSGATVAVFKSRA